MMQQIKRYSNIILIGLCMLFFQPAKAQELVDSLHSLTPFFQELYELENGKDTVLSIVHLGDSHIQAGYYSGTVMRLLHSRFGNAGRGWIAPFKFLRTNEPDDYFIRSNVRKWTGSKITKRKPKYPIGPGGIGVYTPYYSINFNLLMTPVNGAGYGFNQVLLFRGERSLPMLPTDKSKNIAVLRRADTVAVEGLVVDTFDLTTIVDTLQMHSSRRKKGTNTLLPASSFRSVYYGFNLLNGNKGLLYHSVGVNGGMFVDFTKEEYIQRLALLKPSLLIVSLGTNESFGRNFTKKEFSSQAKAFLDLVRIYMPQTSILLTSPVECYKRTRNKKRQRIYVRNKNSRLVSQALSATARQENVAFWDLFSVAGGVGSSAKWRADKMMARDRIHFTKEGYQKQGQLLYRALINSYNQYKKTKEDVE